MAIANADGRTVRHYKTECVPPGNIFRKGELQQEVVVKDYSTTTPHGAIDSKTQRKELKLYNLDAFISLDYRVKC